MIAEVTVRRVEPGREERRIVRELLAEMRRYIRARGQAPKLEADDVDLQRAWVALSGHLHRNVKIARRRLRAEFRRAA